MKRPLHISITNHLKINHMILGDGLAKEEIYAIGLRLASSYASL